MHALSSHLSATFTRTSSNFWTSSLLADLSVFPSLICDFCPSDQEFAYSFLQIPPHDGHPCCSAIHFPLPGHVRVGSSDGAVVSVSIACHLKPCMRFSLTRLSDNLLPTAFKGLPHIFSYLDNKSTLFHWLHTTFEIHTTHALCISSVFACNTPVSIASSTRIHQAV